MPDCRVLIIDDDDDVREALIALLVTEGYDAAGAASGLAALTIMTGKRFIPDVILLDLSMPSMDGAQFHAVLQKNPDWSQIPIVVCTGDAEPVTLSVFGVLEKPFDLEKMLEIVKSACAIRLHA
jgi:CheY-like chemotaxis protein